MLARYVAASGLLVLTAACGSSTTPSAPPAAPLPSKTCATAEACGVSFEELRRVNLHYADRLDFHGDPAGALRDERRVKSALTPLASRPATPDDIRAALVGAGFEPGAIQASTNAVRTAGTAFAVSVDGGCVFGAFYARRLTVAVGGYVEDGGCLAEYGH